MQGLSTCEMAIVWEFQVYRSDKLGKVGGVGKRYEKLNGKIRKQGDEGAGGLGVQRNRVRTGEEGSE